MKKKLIIVSMAILLMGQMLTAQRLYVGQPAPSSDSENCFDENSRIINLGVGFGNRSFYGQGLYDSYSQSPAVSLSYEQALPTRVGPGFIGVGGYLGFQSAKYQWDYYNYYYNDYYYYQDKYNYFMIAARAAYHWDVLSNDKLELYFGLLAGLRINTYKHTDSDPEHPYNYTYSGGHFGPVYSGFIGGRWYFAKQFGLYGEVGYGISIGNIGLSVKI